MKTAYFWKDWGESGTEVREDRFERIRQLARQLQQETLARARQPMRPVRRLWAIVLLSLCAVVTAAVGLMVNYNRFIALEQQVRAAMGRVEASLQRRANLFPNLVMLTGSQAVHETEVFKHVAEVRAELLRSNELLGKAGAVVENSGAGPAGSPPGAEAAALSASSLEAMKTSMGKLMAIVENYPDIKAVTTYHQLMTDLVEIETLILEQRRSLNEATRSYNTVVLTFPSRILARLYGFVPYPYFEASEGAHVNPEATGEMLGRSLLPVSTSAK